MAALEGLIREDKPSSWATTFKDHTAANSGRRQAQKPEKVDTAPERDIAAGVREKAKSGKKDDRAVADAVSDLDGND